VKKIKQFFLDLGNKQFVRNKSSQVARIQDVYLTRQSTKPLLVKRLSENIGKLPLSAHMT
jgi:hypothetical protein